MNWAKREYSMVNNILPTQEGRADAKSDGYVAGYKGKKAADTKMRPN